MMAARIAAGALMAVLLGGIAAPAEAGFLFGRRMRGKIVRTFRPIKKIKKIRHVRHIRKGFKNSPSRSSRRRVVYRRYRTRR